ncbi:protein of unknown function [Methylocaldum szegediense]|jgi:hypothetical protein|uniref:Uncharacterized protein n=1 Tax=Methylocaldum szegediense TaxID=73780 RepID=A0ABM9I6K1_9GAMM|nr:protein of unknown function [Methylocaldum szegediense]
MGECLVPTIGWVGYVWGARHMADDITRCGGIGDFLAGTNKSPLKSLFKNNSVLFKSCCAMAVNPKTHRLP